MTEGKWGVIVHGIAHVSSLGQLGERAEVTRNEREKGCVKCVGETKVHNVRMGGKNSIESV